MAYNFVCTSPKLLLVEGEDDKRFFSGFLWYLGIRKGVQIEAYEGKDSLQEYLMGLEASASFKRVVKSLGITRDADSAKASAMQAIHSALHNAGYTESLKELHPNLRIPPISAVVVCDSTGTGRLEEMILEAVDENWRMDCIQAYERCLGENRPEDETPPKDWGKAQLAIYLASLERAAIQTGYWGEDVDELLIDRAARKYLNLDHLVYDTVREFLRAL